ncbi:MAG: GatB/YqeY domain-containing protein [bacterium]
MDLKSEIFDQMKAAMKDRNQSRVAAFRLIRDAIQKAEIDGNTELDDSGVIRVLARLKKQREESVQAYEKGGREDLMGREKEELQILYELMPKPLTREETESMVATAIREAGAEKPSDMGKVMKALKGKFEGRASGKEISEEVKKQLSS